MRNRIWHCNRRSCWPWWRSCLEDYLGWMDSDNETSDVLCKPRIQEQQEADAYQSDPRAEKGRHQEQLYGPEMLETWLLLEFCDRCAFCV